VLMG